MFLSALNSRLRVALAPIIALALIAGGVMAGAGPASAVAASPAAPTLTVTPSAEIDSTKANDIIVTGSGYFGPNAFQGVYLMLGETSYWSGNEPLKSGGWVVEKFVSPGTGFNAAAGTFSYTLQVPAGALDPEKSYHVATSAAHGASASDRTLDAFKPITVKQPVVEPPVVEPPVVEPPVVEPPVVEPPVVEPPAAVVPEVKVSKTEGLNPEGETVTVTGSGFVPTDKTTALGQPLTGKFGGAYVAFGKFAPVWKASEGAATAARKTFHQRWGVHESEFDRVGGASAGAIVIDAEGNFTAEINVKKGFAGELAEGSYGIYTYPGGRATEPLFETYTPVVFEEPVVPEVKVSKTEGLNPEGETVTVTGSGFVPTDKTTALGQPLTGKFGGAYVAFGKFAPVWKASEGAATAARKTFHQRWGVHESEFDRVGGASAGAIVIDAEGNFTAEINVKKGFAGELAEGSYGIYTYPGGRATEPLFETYTPVVFEEPVVPEVKVSKTEGLNPEGETVTVTGSGFVPTDKTTALGQPLTGKFGGAYVAFGKFAPVWKASEGAATAARKTFHQRWGVHESEFDRVGGASAGAIVIDAEGNFTAEINVKKGFAGELAEGSYGIYTYPGGRATEPLFETYTPVVFEEPVIPQVTVTPNTDIDSTVKNTLTVTGKNFTGPAAKFGTYLYAGLSSSWPAGSTTPPTMAGWIKTGWVQPTEIVNGSFTATIEIPAGSFDPTQSYQVATSAAHGLVGAERGLDTHTPLAIRAGVPVPQITVAPGGNINAGVANEFTITGTGFDGIASANAALTGLEVRIGDIALWNGTGALPEQGWVGKGFVTAESVKDGRFSAKVSVPRGAFLKGVSYQAVVAARTVGAPAVDTFSARAPIAVVHPNGATVTVDPSNNVEPNIDNVFTVRGSGFTGSSAQFGAYVLIGKQSYWSGQGPLPSGGWLAEEFIPPAKIAADGTFSVKITIPAGKFEPGVRYHAATSAAHGLSATDRSLDAFAEITIKQPVTSGPRVSVTPQNRINPAVANTFTVTGSDFLGEGAANGVYILIGEKSFWSGNGPLPDGDGWLTSVLIPSGAVINGSFIATLTVPAGAFRDGVAYQLVTSAAHGLSVTDRSLDTFTTLGISAGGGTTPIVPPTDPVVVAPVTPAVAGGSLRWSIKNQYNDYVQGPIAKGSVSALAGATRSNGVFQFGQAAISSYDRQSGTGSVSYSGAVNFSGHNGALNFTLANPVITINSPSSATLTTTLNGRSIVFGTLNLGAATRSENGAATTWSGVPVSVTAAGGELFQGRYDSADPLSFTIGAPAAAPAGASGTVLAASAASKAAALPIPATPPASTGLILDEATLAALANGEVGTVTADGFQPNEKNIRVIVYSDPIVLGTISANAAGVASWTGSLPATLEPGEHTLTFQGSVNKGVVITVAAPDLAEGCTVEGATLSWGFKASFLNYIEGIARGEYVAGDGATFTYPAFGFTAGTGHYLSEKASGLVTWPGSIHFTGHGGILDTTVSNPRIELVDASTAFLLLDIHGTTQDGAAVDQKSVRFATLAVDGSNLTRSGDALVGTAIPAALTAEGSAAFGTYPAGEALDAVTFEVPLPADCGSAPVTETKADPKPVQATVTSAVVEEADNSWMWWTGGGILLLGAAAAITIVAIRRKRAGIAAE
ncbi:HtaA domain-containing protein [Mycetocola spongiae]|uniref:HtaA domain-containing protein n=1 Tax=Mycetocola spongiae TaxID=2859226 RepID=UPI001CF2CDD1|nr:HtaA domain-containing protein [Mycetocola spongiae]UCR88441.1 HtaA domain-containing protein [Mycetocola spongiae]